MGLCDGGAGDGLLSRDLSIGVPSALQGLTIVFGMGTSVAPALQSPANYDISPTRAGAYASGIREVLAGRSWSPFGVHIMRALRLMIPFGSSQAARAIRTAALGTPCGDSTGGLSTEWSPPALQGAQGSGRIHLGGSFPLRCFQRLSAPIVATRRCPWQDSRDTSGSSDPVLSY